MLHLRVDDDIKEQAKAALTAIGSPILEKYAANKRAVLPQAADEPKAFLKG